MAAGDDFWNALTPDEQDQVMSTFGMMGPPPTYEDFGDFGGGGGGAFNFTYGGGGSPVQPYVGGFQTKGEVDPMDRTQEAGRVNLLQDYGALSVDNILSGYGGPGSYDIDAFTPTYDYGEPLNLKGRRKAESLAGTGGWQGFVTDLILNQQMSPAEAEAMLYKVIEAPDDPSLSQKERDQKAALADSMKPLMAPDTGAPTSLTGRGTGQSAATTAPYDAVPIREFTTRVWSDLMEDPEFKYQDPESGLYYDKTPEEALVKTPQMLAYDKFGIPYPIASYEDPEYLDAMAGSTEPERQAAMVPFEEELYGISQQRGEAVDRMGRSREAERGLRELAANPQARAVNRGGENPYGLPTASLKAAQTASELDMQSLMENEGAPGRPTRDTFYDQAIERANRNRAAAGLPPISSPGGLQTSASAEDRQASLDAASTAADLDYESAFKDWQTENRDRLTNEAMTRGADKQGIQTPGTAPFVSTNQRGDIVPYTFGQTDPTATLSDIFSGRTLIDGLRGNRRRMSEEDLPQQRQRGKAANKDRYAAERAFQQAQEKDPRRAQAAALGRALALSRLGRTPYLDAMESRNANSARMLRG